VKNNQTSKSSWLIFLSCSKSQPKTLLDNCLIGLPFFKLNQAKLKERKTLSLKQRMHIDMQSFWRQKPQLLLFLQQLFFSICRIDAP